MIIAISGHGGPQNVGMPVHGANCRNQEYQKLNIVLRCFSRVEQVVALVIRDGPVHMFAGSVDLGKGLFMQQSRQPVLFGNGFEGVHDHLVVIDGQIGFLVNRRNFILARGNFVVTRLRRYAQLEKLLFHIVHVGGYPLLDAAEVLVFQFLTLGRGSAHNGSSAQNQIRTFEVVIHINQKIFLLGTKIGKNSFDVFDSQDLEHLNGAFAQRADGT